MKKIIVSFLKQLGITFIMSKGDDCSGYLNNLCSWKLLHSGKSISKHFIFSKRDAGLQSRFQSLIATVRVMTSTSPSCWWAALHNKRCSIYGSLPLKYVLTCFSRWIYSHWPRSRHAFLYIQWCISEKHQESTYEKRVNGRIMRWNFTSAAVLPVWLFQAVCSCLRYISESSP